MRMRATDLRLLGVVRDGVVDSRHVGVGEHVVPVELEGLLVLPLRARDVGHDLEEKCAVRAHHAGVLRFVKRTAHGHPATSNGEGDSRASGSACG